MSTEDWYRIENIATLDSPALVVYPDRVRQNITTLVNSIDDVTRLRPHVKTHKSNEVTRMMLAAGIKKFKCATIAEAEMLATEGAPDVLLAYQPVGPKGERLASLTERFPNTTWACLVDNLSTAQELSSVFEKAGSSINLFIDLNVGMNRTGIVPEEAATLFEKCLPLKGITITGLHAYDGHLRDTDMHVRTRRCDEAFARVTKLQEEVLQKHNRNLAIVAGGTPTFSIHSKRKAIECSPGTFIYWDKGYEQILQEQHYLHAALVITRVVSLPAENVICTDLGHKGIASENPLPNRVFFLNAPELEPVGHSEEHLVLKTAAGKSYRVGDVLYGVPYHVCPTVALYDTVSAVSGHRVSEHWTTASRKRKISV
jgi:D-serine deaminase-like pyridoxal phosphate-dependent protein